jgi:hypothetical protein
VSVTAKTHQEVQTENLNFRNAFRTIMKRAVTNLIRICRRESGRSVHEVTFHEMKG